MIEKGSLYTYWDSKDPVIILMLRWLNELPENSRERLEAEANLHMMQAKVCWKQIAEIDARKD